MVDAIQGRFDANIAYPWAVVTASPDGIFAVRWLSRAALIALILGTVIACNTDDAAGNPDTVAREGAIDDVWHKAALRGVTFRAIGQEPGWLLEIVNGKSIIISTDYGNNVAEYAYVEPIVFQDEQRTRYLIEDADAIVEIRDKPCMDIMSGESFAVSVSITDSHRRLEGCGRALF